MAVAVLVLVLAASASGWSCASPAVECPSPSPRVAAMSACARLRERVEDIPLLVKSFLVEAANPQFDANLVEFTDDALAVLNDYGWPGNLTELSQVITEIASTTPTRIVTSQQLPNRLRDVKTWPSLAEHLAIKEKQYREAVLRACGGDKVTAAKVLSAPV